MDSRLRFAVLLVFVLRTCIAADCPVPSYREGHVWEDSPSSIMMNISLSLNDFAPARVVCLAAALKRRYSGRKQISIFMFSTYDGAKKYDVPFSGDSPKPRINWSLQEHGSYSFDAAKGEEAVYIMPFGDQFRTFNTRINLPATSIPPCTLEIAGRCLLALSRIEYPWEALKARSSGTVTLEAVIARDGRVTHVRKVGGVSKEQEGELLLAGSALQNLRDWRFEAVPKEDSIQIAFSYMIEDSGNPGTWSFQFDLPRKVDIRGRPPE